MRLRDVVVMGKVYLRRWLGKGPGKKILDVGSGHRPHEDATHLMDQFAADDYERGGSSIKRLGRPLVLGAIEAIPFKDKTFDYVYASHVLEHTKEPAAACNELVRVALAGYVETPSPFYEQGYNYPNPVRGWPMHHWFVFLDGDETLIFEPKTSQTIDTFCDCRYAQFIKRVYASVGDLNRIHNILPHECNYTVLRWTGHFNFEVREVPQVLRDEKDAVRQL